MSNTTGNALNASSPPREVIEELKEAIEDEMTDSLPLHYLSQGAADRVYKICAKLFDAQMKALCEMMESQAETVRRIGAKANAQAEADRARIVAELKRGFYAAFEYGIATDSEVDEAWEDYCAITNPAKE